MHSQTQFCWLKEHPINLPWLLIPLADTLKTLLTPTIVDIQQQTDLQIATECHPTAIQRKQDLPVRIPAPSCIPEWPQHLLPRQGDFETTTARAVQNLSLLRALASSKIHSNTPWTFPFTHRQNSKSSASDRKDFDFAVFVFWFCSLCMLIWFLQSL